MKIAEWMSALSYLCKFMLDNAVDYPAWKIEQVIEYFTEEEKNEAILFYIKNANLDDYKTCNKERFIAQWISKADCFDVRNNTKTALEYLEAYGLADVPNKTNIDPEDLAERHKYRVDVRFEDCTLQTVKEVIEAANRDLLRQLGLTDKISIYHEELNRELKSKLKSYRQEEYLCKRGLDLVPQILRKTPCVISKRHKADVERLLAERTAEIGSMMEGILKKYLIFYMEAQIEKEVSNMILNEAGKVNTVEKARENYKPEKIEYLLIAEAPPDAINRFFYYENVEKADYLFLGIMEVLDKELKDQYLESHRSPEIKKLMLESFKYNNFFLVDLLELPSHKQNNLKQARVRAVPGLIERIDKIVTKDIPIILIKVDVYAVLYKILRDKGYRVINARIDFPSSGNQKKFYEQFSRALENTDWDVNRPLRHPSDS